MVDTDLMLSAVNVKYIFELYIVTRRIGEDKRYHREWAGQSRRDLEEVISGMTSLATSFGEPQASKELTGIDAENAALFAGATLHGVPLKYSRKFNMSDLADACGKREEYKSFYKMCSKISHPSALRVMTLFAEESGKDFLAVLVIYRTALLWDFVEMLKGMTREWLDSH